MAKVIVDVNPPEFLASLVALERSNQKAVLKAFQKLRQLTWDQLYRDQGLKWEKVHSIQPPQGIDSLYSFRVTQALRAVAYRDGDYLRVLYIQPDHDKAYGKK